MSGIANTRKVKPNDLSIWKRMARCWQLYILVLPAVLCIIIFAYAPMYGVQIAFKDYKVNLGITGSPWAGLKYFKQFINLPNFETLMINTLKISVYSLLWGFPAPVLLALMLNQVKYKKYKSFVQTVTYAPYFISTVVLVSMLSIFLTPSSGFVNKIIEMMGGKAIAFMGEPRWFRTVYVASGVCGLGRDCVSCRAGRRRSEPLRGGHGGRCDQAAPSLAHRHSLHSAHHRHHVHSEHGLPAQCRI